MLGHCMTDVQASAAACMHAAQNAYEPVHFTARLLHMPRRMSSDNQQRPLALSGRCTCSPFFPAGACRCLTSLASATWSCSSCSCCLSSDTLVVSRASSLSSSSTCGISSKALAVSTLCR